MNNNNENKNSSNATNSNDSIIIVEQRKNEPSQYRNPHKPAAAPSGAATSQRVHSGFRNSLLKVPAEELKISCWCFKRKRERSWKRREGTAEKEI